MEDIPLTMNLLKGALGRDTKGCRQLGCRDSGRLHGGYLGGYAALDEEVAHLRRMASAERLVADINLTRKGAYRALADTRGK